MVYGYAPLAMVAFHTETGAFSCHTASRLVEIANLRKQERAMNEKEAREGVDRFDRYIAEAQRDDSPLRPYLAHYIARRADWAFVAAHYRKQRGKRNGTAKSTT